MSSLCLLMALSFSWGLFMATGCCPVRQATTSETYQSRDREETRERFEHLYYGVIDSLRNVKAPVENSSSYGRKESELKTSLAWSKAAVDSLGNLLHEMGNNDSIPSKVVYKWRDRIIRDSIYIDRTDTVRVSKTVEVVRELTGWQRIQVNAGRMLFVLLLAFAAYIIYRWKLK